MMSKGCLYFSIVVMLGMALIIHGVTSLSAAL
jgi:hypothetical protein